MLGPKCTKDGILTFISHLLRPRNPRFKDAHAGTKRSLKAKTINRDSGISGTASTCAFWTQHSCICILYYLPLCSPRAESATFWFATPFSRATHRWNKLNACVEVNPSGKYFTKTEPQTREQRIAVMNSMRV